MVLFVWILIAGWFLVLCSPYNPLWSRSFLDELWVLKKEHLIFYIVSHIPSLVPIILRPFTTVFLRRSQHKELMCLEKPTEQFPNDQAENICASPGVLQNQGLGDRFSGKIWLKVFDILIYYIFVRFFFGGRGAPKYMKCFKNCAWDWYLSTVSVFDN